MEPLSASQLVDDAYKEGGEQKAEKTDLRIQDAEELLEYQFRIRSSYEKALQFKRTDLPQYVRYARWEWELHNYTRARSILERALSVDHSKVQVWSAYIDLELTSGNINHARNLLERATTLLPRVDKFYYDYIQLEEKLHQFGNCKAIFRNWTHWNPSTKIYSNYIKFLSKYNDFDSLRLVYEDLCRVSPTTENLISFINFEIKHGDPHSTRTLFDLIISDLIKLDKLDPQILTRYLDYETSLKNIDKLRQILLFALSKAPTEVILDYTKFEQEHGSHSDIEKNILLKRKLKFESEPHENLESCWEYLDILDSLQELNASHFETCLLSLDNSTKTYVLWIRYAFFTELSLKDPDSTRSIYKKISKIYPENTNLWIKYAMFEIRQNSLAKLRKIFGFCLGKLPRCDDIVSEYIDLEMKLNQPDRVRKIFETYLGKNTRQLSIWLKFIDFEEQNDEVERVNSLYEIVLDEFEMDLKIFDKFLKWLHSSMQYEETRSQYKLMYEKTQNVNIYISMLLNELLIPTEEQLKELKAGTSDEFEITSAQIGKTASIFEKGLSLYKSDNENRVILFFAFKKFIGSYDPEYDLSKHEPKLVKKIVDGEEKLEYVFEDKPLSFLENAKKWLSTQK